MTRDPGRVDHPVPDRNHACHGDLVALEQALHGELPTILAWPRLSGARRLVTSEASALGIGIFKR